MSLHRDQLGGSSLEEVPVSPITGCFHPAPGGEGTPVSEVCRKMGISE